MYEMCNINKLALPLSNKIQYEYIKQVHLGWKT